MKVGVLYERLIAYEFDEARPPDGRRVVSAERLKLRDAGDRAERLGRIDAGLDSPASRQAFEQAMKQRLDVARAARRVALHWGVPGVEGEVER